MLRGLGWEFLRVWSTDWWIDAEGTQQKLDASVRALLETNRAQRVEEAARQAARMAEAAVAEAGAAEQTTDPVMAETYARNAAEMPMFDAGGSGPCFRS